MSDTLTLSMILGAVAPLVVAVINRPSWSSQKKQLVAVAASVVAAVVALFLTDGFNDVGDTSAIVLLVIGTAQAAYALIWKPTNIALAIEEKTSPAPEAA
jgi:uncharacterized membrane protein